MAKKKKKIIEPTLFQCPVCKKKYFSYHDRLWCTECTKENEASKGETIAPE